MTNVSVVRKSLGASRDAIANGRLCNQSRGAIEGSLIYFHTNIDATSAVINK